MLHNYMDCALVFQFKMKHMENQMALFKIVFAVMFALFGVEVYAKGKGGFNLVRIFCTLICL